MRQIKNSIVLIILIFFMSGPSFASDDLPKQGATLKDGYTVYSDGLTGISPLRSIPLPSGDWIVISARNLKSRNTDLTPVSIPLRELILAQIDKNNRLIAAMVLTTNLDQHRWNWHADFCKDQNNNFLYSNTYGTALWDQRCTNISAVPYLQSSEPGTQAVREFYNSRNIEFASNAIKVHASKYDRMGNIVRADIFYFPNTYGLENPYASNSESSPWSKDAIGRDPIKLKFINGLKQWSEDYSTLVVENFEGQKKFSEALSLYKFQN